MANEKPPLGVAPHWYFYPRRIIDLLEAALRYANFSLKHKATRAVTEDYKLIAQWAREIASLADLMAELEGNKHEN